MEAMRSSIIWFAWVAVVLALAREAHCNTLAEAKGRGEKKGSASIENELSEGGGVELSELGATEKITRKPDQSSKCDDDGADQDAGQDEDEDEDGALAASASEGSRSVGGTPVQPPNWLTSSWYPPDGEQRNKFAGHMIRLNKNVVLAHQDTCNNPQLDWAGKRKGEQVALRMPSTVNVREGSKVKGERTVGCSIKQAGELGHKFGVFRLTQERGSNSYLDLINPYHYKGAPALQHDPKVNDNCFLHSYSGNKDPRGNPQDDRVFSKLEVHHRGCTKGLCTFNSRQSYGSPHGSEKAGGVCHDLEDRGAPIMCGNDQKLSYVVAGQPHGGCADSFKALRIADHHQHLMHHVNTEPAFDKIDHSKDSFHDIKRLPIKG